MRQIYTAVIALLILSAAQCVAQAEVKYYTSAELINGANVIDGSIVTYKGEIVAAIMNRGESSWINLNDGFNAVGIWCRSASLGDVRTMGDYKNEGDTVEVTGVFHRACPEHGGELDIHADRVRIVATGFPVEERVSVYRINIAIVFFVLTLLAVVVLRKRI